MSRCFPFPPPGYVKTPRPEEDLFQEEKLREKKHKKEKKSKRKKEGGDREERHKDRERKEKKEKKDKHRDKKDVEKVKSSIPDDSTFPAQPGTSDRDNARTREECSNSKNLGFSENKFASALRGQNGLSLTDNKLGRESEESKFVQELGRRIKDEGKAVGSRTIERPSSSGRRGYEEVHRSAVTGGLQSSAKNVGFERDQGVDPKKGEGNGPKKVEGKELKDGLHFNGNNSDQNLTKKVEVPPEPVHIVTERTMQEKDKCKEKSEDKRGEKRKDRDKKEKKSHGKDKGRDKIKQKNNDEEKKRVEMEKQRTEYQKRDQDRSKESNRNEHISFNKNINVCASQVDNNIVSTEEKVKKRKDVETNGFAHVNEIRLNKLRTHQPMNNGKILEACQSRGLLDYNRQCIPLQDTSGTKCIPLQDTSGTKSHELNGTVGPQLSCIPKQKPPSALSIRSDQPIETMEKPLLADQVVEASRKLPQAPPIVVGVSLEIPLAGKVTETSKRAPQASRVVEPVTKPPRADRSSEPSRRPPHPDEKYLSEVLSVPKMEEWSEVDDQEWLFSNKNLPLEKQKPDVSVDSRQQHVWSKALHIESAELYALPYVIPY